MDSAGDFVIAWESGGNQDGSFYGIFAQRYNAAGVEQGSEFQVNTFTPNTQSSPSVAMDAAGDFVIGWTSQNQDGSSLGIFAQRYGRFSDDFDRPDSANLGANWEIPPLAPAFRFQYRRQSGFAGFEVLNNAAVSVGTSFDAEQFAVGSLLNSTLQADVDASDGQNTAVGLFARMQANGNAYAAVLTHTGMAEILLIHGGTDAVPQMLGQFDVGVTSGRLIFTITGGATPTLTLFVNGTQAVQVIGDPSLPTAGGAGIFAQGANGIIDNFLINGS
jgi:hypothetical protein